MAQNDLGNQTAKEILEKRMGPEAASRVMKKVNEAYKQGKSGDDLRKVYKEAVEKEGKKVTSDQNDILFGFLVPADSF
jgi:hypothetical protein